MINDVQNMTIVSTSWWHVNTRPISGGMLLKQQEVSKAIEVQLSEKKRAQIGMDEPEVLLDATQLANVALAINSSPPCYERNHRISHDG